MNKSKFTGVPVVPIVLKTTVDWSFEIVGYLYVTDGIKRFLDSNLDMSAIPPTLYVAHARKLVVTGAVETLTKMLEWDAADTTVVSMASGQLSYVTLPDAHLEQSFTTSVPFV